MQDQTNNHEENVEQAGMPMGGPEPEPKTNESEKGTFPSREIPLPPNMEGYGQPCYQETIKDKRIKKEKVKKERKGPGGFGKFVAGLLIVSVAGGASLGAGYAFTAPLVNRLYQEKYGTLEGGQGVTVSNSNNFNSNTSATSYVQPVTTNNSIADIASNVGPSVVSIKNNKTVTVNTWMGEFAQQQEGLGSGVIFKVDDQKVYIVSNAHVVEGANTLTVTFLGNTKVAANIVGYDTVTDIAVVAVDKADIPVDIVNNIRPAILGDSDALRVGDLAVAIGTPIDEAYKNTVTVGVISAMDREINLTDQKLKLIQTDAAINPGNSGGALVGPAGEVIGINTIKLVDSEIEGMGFAIPINHVKPIIDEIMANGRIIRPSLGIVGENLTEELGSQWEIPVGILVVQVQPGSSADLAGIQPGDVILEFDGERTETMEELKGLLLEKKVDETVKVKVARGSKKATLDVKLREQSGQPTAPTTTPEPATP